MDDAAPSGAIPGFASATATVGGVRLHHRTGGDPGGPPVMLWHGFLGAGHAWRKVAPALADAGLR
jgi:pimeloyl-ACP methyl ester carboxylesterase